MEAFPDQYHVSYLCSLTKIGQMALPAKQKCTGSSPVASFITSRMEWVIEGSTPPSFLGSHSPKGS